MSRNDDEDDAGEERLPRRRRRRREDYDDEDDDLEDRPRGYRREQDIGDDPMMRMLLPVGLSGWAIAAGYLALFSLLCVPGPLALLCGIMAIREIQRNPKKHGMGRAIFGIVMGSLGSLVLVFALVSFLLASFQGRR